MDQLNSCNIVSNIGHLHASNSSSEIPTQSNENNQVSTLKDTNTKKDPSLHIRHFNIPNENIGFNGRTKTRELLEYA